MEDLPYLSESREVSPPRTSMLQRLEQHVKTLEDYLRCGIYDQDYQDELLELVKGDVGDDEQGYKCSLRALGYPLDLNDTLIPTLEVIDTETAYRHDIEIRQVADTERVLIHYEVFNQEVGFAAYYVPPLAVLSSVRGAVTPDVASVDHPALRLMDTNADKVQENIFVSGFFAANVSEQERILAHIADDLHDVLEVEYGSDVPVSIGARSYYRLLPDVDFDEIKWDEYYYEAPGVGEELHYTLEGTIVNVVYLEALGGLHKKIENIKELALGNGFPCILLADQAGEVIYYIPVVGIASFHSKYDDA